MGCANSVEQWSFTPNNDVAQITEEPKQNFRTYVHTISISLQTSSKESASSSMMFAAAALRRVVPRAAARRSMSTKNRADLLAGAG